MPSVLEGRRIHIAGPVQGVGFRPWVYRAAQQAGVTGRVRNEACGVTIGASRPNVRSSTSFGVAAVHRLRERKHRDEKPLAVMVRTLKAAAIGYAQAAERRLLTSSERPIVT